ncbi:MAG TPA: hypothetical protein DIT64_18460 [Verrucomicrobiales bacterium]|mgnify:FL=1|nr:hypothetical protein [Verrucomicrobiales bacterium]
MKKSLFLMAGMLVMSCLVAQAQQKRIVGGINTTSGEYPFMTALVEKGATPSSGQFCGAALVAPQWVLTAAHCLEGTPASTLDVWVGGHDLRTASQGVRVAVSQVIMHPNYRETSQGALVNDFCLLKLASPVTTRATLPLVETSDQIAVGTMTRVLGWGATREGGAGSKILRQADVPLVSLTLAGVTNPGLNSTHLAAGFATGGVDSCQGDSGGPLMVPGFSGQWLHAGTVSYGNGCARPNEYGIYGNTLTLKPWIIGHIGDPGEPPKPDPVDDHGNTTAAATTLAVNGTLPGVLEAGGDLDVFKISAPGAGVLTVTSGGGTDVTGTLLGSTGAALASDDNGNGAPNFRLTRTLTAAGTYYVRVAGVNSSTSGAYSITSAFTTTTGGDIALKTGTTALPMNATLNFGALQVNAATVERTLTLTNTGTTTLTIVGASFDGADAGSFHFVSLPAASLAKGKSTSFIISCAPDRAGALSARLLVQSSAAGKNPYPVNLVASATATTPDDHGNNFYFATAAPVPGGIPGVINHGADKDFFVITVAVKTTVTMKTTGFVDTYGTLYSSAGKVLKKADDTGRDLNFTLKRALTPGTYYLCVEGYDRHATGPYTLLLSR